MKRKSLAIIGVGMVGSGVLQQGIPAMSNTLEILSRSIDVTIYSFIHITKSATPSRIRVRSAISFLPQRLNDYWLWLRFVLDHLIRNYDCIHAQSPFPAGQLAVRLNALFKTRIVTTIHAGEIALMPDQNFGDLRRADLKTVAAIVCTRSHHLIFMSAFQAQDLKRNLGIERDFVVLPRGVEVESLVEKKITTPVKLLHVGYYHPIKNQVMLLDTLKILSKKIRCELKIIGSNYGDEFKAMISQYGLSELVTLVGALPYREMKEHYEEAHMLLHTSWFEGLPMVAIEAMAYGAVVCGTHVGIMADLSEESCLTVPPGDAEALANVVISLTENPAKYEKLRLRGHDWAKSHDLIWHVRQLNNLYFS